MQMDPAEMRVHAMALLESLPEPQRTMARMLGQAACWAVEGKLAGMHMTLVMSDGVLLCAREGVSADPEAVDPRQTHAAPELRQ